MLVKSIKPFQNYARTREIPVGKLFVVYAIEHDKDGDEYFIFPAGLKLKAFEEPDPLFFEAKNFEIVDDKVSKDWVTKTVDTGMGPVKYSSFPEWFKEDFHIRAHDWSLEGDDYKVIRKYKEIYERLYESYLHSS